MSNLGDLHSIASSITLVTVDSHGQHTKIDVALPFPHSSPSPHFRILYEMNRPENATRMHCNAHATPYENAQRLQSRERRKIANTHYQDISFQDARQ